MEVIMSSPVNQCLGMENDIGRSAVKLIKAQKKMKANQEDTENSKSKPEVHLNTISPSSLRDNPNTGFGTSANVEQKMTESSPATPGVRKSSILAIENDSGNGAVKLNKSQKRNRRKSINANREDAEKILVSKSEDRAKVANGEMGSSVATNLNAEVKLRNKIETAVGETSSGTNETGNKASKKRKRNRLRKSEIFSTHESTEEMVLAKNDSSATTNVNLKGMAKEQNKMETVIGEMGSGTSTTDNTTSKKRKRKRVRNKNPSLSGILSTHESTQDTVIAKNDSSATMNVNVKGMAEEQKKMEKAIGETASCTNTTDNPRSRKRKRKRLRNKNPSSSGILSTREITQDTIIAKNDSSATTNVNVKGMAEEQNEMEKVIGETASFTNTTDNTTSKKQKRKKLKNKNPDKNPGSGDVISTHESTQDTVIAKNDSSATTNLNMKGVTEEQNKPKSQSVSPLSGDILNPQYSHNLEPSKGEMGSGTTATDKASIKKRKRQKSKNTNSAPGDILSTRESTEGMVTAKKESSTTNVLEAVSGQIVSQGEEHMKSAIGKKGSGAIKNLNVNDAGKMENKPKSKNMRPTFGENLNPQYVKAKDLVIAEAEAKAKENQALIRNFWRQRNKNQKMGIREVFQAPALGKKLLIFDVNGLLADIVSPRPKDVVADLYVPRKAIFKRPFLEDFLHFCFERFNVAIWSSRTKNNLNLAVDFLLGDLKKKLIFLWDATKCTNTGIKTLEDKHKCIVLKDLRKIWENGANDSRWVKGTFNESNTLLLDDSPYKALLNPKHSGIYPTSYCYKNRDDNLLGPESELRTYLEGLAACDNVKTYVEQHPFGQGVIDENSPHWGFYKQVVMGRTRTRGNSLKNHSLKL